jgi:hypothetical protein
VRESRVTREQPESKLVSGLLGAYFWSSAADFLAHNFFTGDRA